MNDLDTLQNQALIPQERAQYIRQQFAEFEGVADNWRAKAESLVVTSEEQVGEMQMARAGRLAIGKVRIAVEKTRKKLNENVLEEKRLIDGIAKRLTNLISPIEEHLKAQETFAERLKAKRMEELIAKRKGLLEAEGMGVNGLAFELMTEEEFGQMLDMAKAAKIAREEKERKEAEEAAAKAKAEAEERERQRLEMERLRKENAERERQLAEERAKAEAERKAAEARERAQREEQEKRLSEERAKAAEEARKAKEIADKKAAEERAAREKVEAELRAKKAKEEADAKAKAEEERKLLEGPEIDRIKAWLIEMNECLDSAPKLDESSRFFKSVWEAEIEIEKALNKLEALCDA